MERKYFRQFWCYVEWGMICCSWSSIGIYIWRYYEMKRIGEVFRRSKGYDYVNLQLATYMNDTLTSLLGFCCFFGTVKLLRFCQYHRRLSLLADTLRYVEKDLFFFTTSFGIMIMAFIVLFYLLFVSKIWACSTLLHTVQMVFETILMKFNASEIRAADYVLGPICFVLFIIFVVFIGKTMFVSIISDEFRSVQEKYQLNSNEDFEVFGYMWDKFLQQIGLRKQAGWKLQEERDKKMRSEYYDPIERFPDKLIGMDAYLCYET
ncbi:hypothetical protein I4U23_020154 [Adineta vaga]|nr:hypothetical protein I4U23_020154 [Adineta vaga]